MKMAVIGCGLIGGSMALSWKRAGIVDEVIAFGHSAESLGQRRGRRRDDFYGRGRQGC